MSEDTNVPLNFLSPKGTGTLIYSKRTWVGLTDEDKSLFSSWLDHKTDAEVFTAIEAKLKEKNYG
jgi:hypothetical protein